MKIKEFIVNSKKWKQETKHLSNVEHIVQNEYYQNIIKLGKEVVPFIIEDLIVNGPNHWFNALSVITGKNPIQEKNAGRMDAMTLDWIRWAYLEGYFNYCD